jgi:uncharacterized protein YdeI (YjbR/CyaY-like superfamily)
MRIFGKMKPAGGAMGTARRWGAGGAMIEDVEAYFAQGCGRCPRFATPDCSARRWASGLAVLRGLCRGAGLEEQVKWGHPCYMHAGRNVAILGAFRAEYRISFFDAGLLDDPEGVLERQGPNSPVADAIRFRDDAAPAAMLEVVGGFLRQAMAHAEAGRRAPRAPGDLDLPEDLIEALDADPELAEAFAGLTPGRQRSYVIALSSAKAPATRVARIERFRARILAGKGATER